MANLPNPIIVGALDQAKADGFVLFDVEYGANGRAYYHHKKSEWYRLVMRNQRTGEVIVFDHKSEDHK